MGVEVTFSDDTVKVKFLGYEVWIRRKPGEDIDAAITRMVFNTFRGSQVPIEADADKVLRDVLEAIHSHRDFPIWEVQSA